MAWTSSDFFYVVAWLWARKFKLDASMSKQVMEFAGNPNKNKTLCLNQVKVLNAVSGLTTLEGIE